MKKMRWLALCTALLISGMSFAGCNGKVENSAADSATETVESTEEETKELVPNAEGDFLWHALTADEIGNSQYVGGVIITGYVGNSTDVVIPKVIDNKPVVAIAEFAFSSIAKEDIWHVESDGSDADPLLTMADYLGFIDENDRIYAVKDFVDDNFGENNCEELLEELNVSVKRSMVDLLRSKSDKMSDKLSQLIEEYGEEEIEAALKFEFDIMKAHREVNTFFCASQDEIYGALLNHEPTTKVKNVYLPNSIKYLLGYSFAFCDSLEKIEVYGIEEGEIPVINVDSIIDIDYEAYPFLACTNLKSTNFYLNVEETGGSHRCYNFCMRLENVNIYPSASGEISLPTGGYDDLDYLTTVNIADDATYIGGYWGRYSDFSGCTFYIPDSVTEIAEHTFCNHLYDGRSEGSPDVEECISAEGLEIITPEGSYAERYAKEHGIKVNGELHEVVKPTEVATEPPTEAATEAQDDDSWKEAYVTEITRFESQNLTENSDFGYALYYIDEDDIPELYMLSRTTGVAAICGFYNGQLICISESGSARDNSFVRCIEYEGTFWTSYSSGAEYWGYNFYEYKGGQVSQFMTMDYNEGTYSYTETGSDPVVISEEEFNQMYAEYPQRGFVYDHLLTHSEVVGSIQGEDQSVSTYDEAITGTIITDEDALNVRIGPSTEYAKLGTIPKGATVYITGENGDWYVIEYGTDTGYILKDYVALD